MYNVHHINFTSRYKPKQCPLCGKVIRRQYKYCFACYQRQHIEPLTRNQSAHRCEKCGEWISNKYKYCYTCAAEMKLFDKNRY